MRGPQSVGENPGGPSATLGGAGGAVERLLPLAILVTLVTLVVLVVPRCIMDDCLQPILKELRLDQLASDVRDCLKLHTIRTETLRG